MSTHGSVPPASWNASTSSRQRSGVDIESKRSPAPRRAARRTAVKPIAALSTGIGCSAQRRDRGVAGERARRAAVEDAGELLERGGEARREVVHRHVHDLEVGGQRAGRDAEADAAREARRHPRDLLGDQRGRPQRAAAAGTAPPTRSASPRGTSPRPAAGWAGSRGSRRGARSSSRRRTRAAPRARPARAARRRWRLRRRGRCAGTAATTPIPARTACSLIVRSACVSSSHSGSAIFGLGACVAPRSASSACQPSSSAGNERGSPIITSKSTTPSAPAMNGPKVSPWSSAMCVPGPQCTSPHVMPPSST